MRDTCPGRGQLADVAAAQMDTVRAPDVAGEPAELLEVLDRAAAVELQAVGLLLGRLGQMRVEGELEAPRQLRRFRHQPAGDRERRARRDRELDAGSGALLVQPGQPFGVHEHGVELLDKAVGRQAAVRLAEIHRASRGDDSDAELTSCLELGLD